MFASEEVDVGYFAMNLPWPVFSWNSSKNRYSPAFIALIGAGLALVTAAARLPAQGRRA